MVRYFVLSAVMERLHWIRLPLIRAFLVIFLFPGIVSSAEKPSAEQTEFFESKIRPILVSECYDCHNENKAKGGLALDSREGLLRGGESGPTIVSGNAASSLLFQAISYAHPELKMPKNAGQLSTNVIRDFAQWINDGAIYPARLADSSETNPPGSWDAVFAARSTWWSFQPLSKPTIPVVKDRSWSSHPVDQFILAKLEEKGLAPGKPADDRALVRRISFALTGLPPTVESVEQFLQDPSQIRYERLVNRLLASPQFGERWARHWMDLVRYAETHGSEGDPEIPDAWRYRDYLIRAFNADIPYDQILREHIAGDLLPQPRLNAHEGWNESIQGIGHYRLVEHGFQPVDTMEEQIKFIDNQIDVISKAFQGLTVSCARCHDHKFDPISQRDFYALYGILASCRPTQISIDLPEQLRMHRSELERLKGEIKNGLNKAWLAAADNLPDLLLQASRSAGNAAQTAGLPQDEVEHARIEKVKQELADLHRRMRSRVFTQGKDVAGESELPLPYAAWTFDDTVSDLFGNLNGELQAGAAIRNGRLILNGKGAYARTVPLPRSIHEKTLEVWVALSNLQQRGGGAITVESTNGAIFDSIVFAEQESRKWIPGSDGFRRSRGVGGAVESASSDALIHMAITYESSGRISVYRNGQPYGSPYTIDSSAGGIPTFAASTSRILFGLRHTGGGDPYLAGEIEEARLYDRALKPEEIAATFRKGPLTPGALSFQQLLTAEETRERERLEKQLQQLQAEFDSRYPDFQERMQKREQLLAELKKAEKTDDHVLHLWALLKDLDEKELPRKWQELASQSTQQRSARDESNAKNFKLAWDLAKTGDQDWYKHGVNPPEHFPRPGEFGVEPNGNQIISPLWPAGIFSHRLSQKHNGVLTSPRFKVEGDWLSVRVLGGKDARVRLIIDNYPLGGGNIFPNATLRSDEMGWIRLDTAYRKGSWAYLELSPADEMISRERRASKDGRSYFGIEKVVFHESKEGPKEEPLPTLHLLEQSTPDTVKDLALLYARSLRAAVEAWQAGTLTERQHAMINGALRSGLLPNSHKDVKELASFLEQYRTLEQEIPVPRRAPGVIEADAQDAGLMARGDYKKLQGSVPRGFLQLVSQKPYETPKSGRLELAADIANPRNPLTARVAVNRVWHYLFGRGLVPTVDNFGRLGDKPTHPELLDFLASYFIDQQWSTKELIRFLFTSRVYQLASEPTPESAKIDPANDWLSHARVQRLEAEAIRDALLHVSGKLDTSMYGPPSRFNAPLEQKQRRSVYLNIQRNNLSPFLEVFDAPKPFTTLGRREKTNVPAQSLALLNDPIVIQLADHWAGQVMSVKNQQERIQLMFQQALARTATPSELDACRKYLAELAAEHGTANDLLSNRQVWRDFAQSIFNLKEFVYLR